MLLALVQIALCVFNGLPVNADTRRPIYNIGHMVNSIPEVADNLEKGANALESDITFHPDGRVDKIYHGSPCDCFRNCEQSANLGEYLDHVRNITTPGSGSYVDRLIFQFFDLKLTNVREENLVIAGQQMADHVLNNLWMNVPDGQKIRVLLYINTVNDKNTILGFRQRFEELGLADQLQHVGYDGGMDNDLEKTKAMWESINVTSNIWQGDGTINCVSAFYPLNRLRRELVVRNSNGYINKVYHWTIDGERTMHHSLELGVDGMITNRPDVLSAIVRNNENLRLATVHDPPFDRFAR